MPCFELTVNGRRVATAGLPGPGVISAHLTWIRDKHQRTGRAWHSLGGLDANVDPNEHVSWSEGALHVGDEVLFRVVDVETPDPPAERWSTATAQRNEKQLHRELANAESAAKRIRRQFAELEKAKRPVRKRRRR